MHWHAAHGNRLTLMLPPAGERDIEHAGGHFRILKEQFEEVAHAIEQQGIACFTL